MNKTEFFISLILCFLLAGCSGNSLDSRIEKINSGTYHVTGTEIHLRYDFPWPSWGGEEVILSRDTIFIEFTVEIEYPPGKKDTVRFKGLEGVNAGEYQVLEPGCFAPRCFADVNLSGTELIFAFGSPSGTYSGKGQLGGERINLETHFEYRNVGIDYFLEGTKLDD